MSRTYADYLWRLLPKRFTTTLGELNRLVTGIGTTFDAALTRVGRGRTGFVPGTAEDAFLPLHGADRMLPRRQGMTVAAWRALLVAARALYEAGGTVGGIVTALECLGCTDVVIDQSRGPLLHDGMIVRDGRFRYSEQRWAGFHVTLTLPAGADEASLLPIIWAEIREWKRIGTLCTGVTVREV
jgi:hypothetical protein